MPMLRLMALLPLRALPHRLSKAGLDKVLKGARETAPRFVYARLLWKPSW